MPRFSGFFHVGSPALSFFFLATFKISEQYTCMYTRSPVLKVHKGVSNRHYRKIIEFFSFIIVIDGKVAGDEEVKFLVSTERKQSLFLPEIEILEFWNLNFGFEII